jgi:hypothetical protein
VLVITEVGGSVTLDCGQGRTVTVPAAPVREHGSGWFLHPDGWLVTTAQVVALAQDPRAIEPMLRENGVKAACLAPALERRGLRPGERPDVEDELMRQFTTRVTPSARVKVDRGVAVLLPNGVRLPARVVKTTAGGAVTSRDLALLKVDTQNVPTLPLADSGQTKIGDRLHVIGFPDVVMTHELLSASAKVEPSVTGGAVSGFKEDVGGRPIIQTDASAAVGYGGGPAVSDRGDVVGVMTFVSRAASEEAAVQGFNFIVPSASVRDLLKDSGVAPGVPGRFTEAWTAGLRAFFAGKHPTARASLAEANRLMPGLPDVLRITAENDERIKNPPPRPFPWRTTGIVLTALGLLGCAIAWLGWWKRNRFRVRPREIAEILDSGENSPVLLDVRDNETYRRSPVRIPRSLHVAADQLEAGTSLPVETNRPVVAYCT